MACFTVAELGSSVLVLKKWDMISLAQVSATIGSQSRVLTFVVNLGANTVLSSIATAGLIVYVGETSYQAMIHGMQFYSAGEQRGKEQAYQELCHDLLNLIEGSTDLVALTAPLIFTLNPSVIVALALLSRGTGIVCFLIR